MDALTVILRTVFVYFFILMIMRIMGKREIGKLSIFDLVVSIMIAELAIISIDNISEPLFESLIPIIVLFFTQIGLSYLSLKSEKLRNIFDGKPSILVENGQIREAEMRKQRYNLDDLLMQLRENRIHSLTQVEFAILEPSGKLTVFPKEEKQSVTREDLDIQAVQMRMPTILIKDGVVKQEALESLDKNMFWLKSELKNRAGVTTVKKISFCSIDTDGEWYIDLQDE